MMCAMGAREHPCGAETEIPQIGYQLSTLQIVAKIYTFGQVTL